MKDLPIGVLDSGIGGFNILNQLIKFMPNEDYIYFGDSARCPFGSRPENELRKIGCEIADFLLSKNCKLIVLACNTLTINTLNCLRTKFSQVGIIGVNNGVKQAVDLTKNKKIGILSTQATIMGEYHEKEIKKADNSISVFSQACPGWADSIDKNKIMDTNFKKLLTKYTNPLIKAQVDTIILACTHYSFIRESLKNFFNTKVWFVDPSIDTANDVFKSLAQKKILSYKRSYGKTKLYFSGNLNIVRKIANKYLNTKFMIQKKVFKE